MNPDAYIEMASTEATHWWFTARRSLLSSFIRGLALPDDARILEIGCGTGGNLQMLAEFGRVSAFEMDASARELAARSTGGQFEIRAGCCPADIPYQGEQFDLICMFDVLEHIDEDIETLRAVRGLLAPGGCALITVPAYAWLWSKHDEFLHHKRRYVATGLRQTALAAGLKPVKLSYFNTLLFPLAVAVRLKDRLFNKTTPSGTTVPAAPVNRLLHRIFSSEQALLAHANLPFGVSLVTVLVDEHPANAAA